MRFQVPQFIDIEDKIFGPLTFKQFIYLLGGAGGIFVLYSTLPLFLAIILGLPIGIFSLALAFYTVNNQPFVKILENAFYYISSSRLYLWKKAPPKLLPKKPELTLEQRQEQIKETLVYTPKLTKSRLEDLAWSLDIKEKTKR